MAAEEVCLDANAVDVSFSKSGMQFAVLTNSEVSLYSWDVQAKPPTAPKLQYRHTLSKTGTRPRRITFLNENEVYIIEESGYNEEIINRLAVDTGEINPVYENRKSEQLTSISADLEHSSLCMYQDEKGRKGGSYFEASYDKDIKSLVTTQQANPNQDTFWHNAIHHESGVSYTARRAYNFY